MTLPGWLDPVLRGAEIAARQVYWRSPGLRRALRRVRSSSPRRGTGPIAVEIDELRAALRRAGVARDGLLMVHNSLDKLILRAGGEELIGYAAAARLIEELRGLLGPGGTLVMPTHPLYPDDPGFMHDKRDLVLAYNPRRTPCRVGLLGEAFRRSKGVVRSRHPLSSLAATGPMAAELLHGNLDESEPLPHGIRSGYYRFCQAGGLAVSINTSLLQALSIAHVAEEVRDEAWPVRNFFYRRRFMVRGDGGDREWVVRERHPIFARNVSLGQLRRDLLRERLLVETDRAGFRIDHADAKGVLTYMLRRNEGGTYPFYGLPHRGGPSTETP